VLDEAPCHLIPKSTAPPSQTGLIRRPRVAGTVITVFARPPTLCSAAQLNETWQSVVTHWRLAEGSDIEILNWLDDHSRLLSCHLLPRCEGSLRVPGGMQAGRRKVISRCPQKCSVGRPIDAR
jgi:hypothetical protein